jgi:hypothetical protein
VEVLSQKELKSVLKSVDGYNDDNLNTFSEYLTDYCEQITSVEMELILEYVTDELDIHTDADLKENDESKLEDLCDYINNLFD